MARSRKKATTAQELLEDIRSLNEAERCRFWGEIYNVVRSKMRWLFNLTRAGTEFRITGSPNESFDAEVIAMFQEMRRMSTNASRRDEQDEDALHRTARLLLEGKKPAEIAKLEHTTAGAIKQRRRRARELGLLPK